MTDREHSQRVVITGMGAVTPLGLSVTETWEGLVAGRSGIDEITQFDASTMPIRLAGEVKDFDPSDFFSFKEARRMSRCAHLALAAGIQAMADAGLPEQVPEPERAGVVVGTAVGGYDMGMEQFDVYLEKGIRRVNPFRAMALLCNLPAHHLSLQFQCQGYNTTVVTACAAGTQALGEAAHAIRSGKADLVIAGGVEGMIAEILIAGFTAMRVLAADNDNPAQACKPFDARRDGFVVAEGSTVMVLERLDKALDRGARIYAEVLGYAANSDAFHVAIPDPEGAGAARAMRWALEDARVAPDEIDYINAHGPGTVAGDPVETLAIKTLFGDRAYQIPISSTKSMVGHALGAAGAIEALACVQSINTHVIHPTINYEVPDPDCDLDYVPNVARQVSVETTLSNSFGLGGQNACLVIRSYQE